MWVCDSNAWQGISTTWSLPPGRLKNIAGCGDVPFGVAAEHAFALGVGGCPAWQSLEERLSMKQDALLERALVLDEVTSLTGQLRGRAAEGRVIGQQLSAEANSYQQRLRAVTRKMMATISELSLYQVGGLGCGSGSCVDCFRHASSSSGLLRQELAAWPPVTLCPLVALHQ